MEKKLSHQGTSKISPQVPVYMVMVVIKTCFTRQEVIEQSIPPRSYLAQGSGCFSQALLALLPFPTCTYYVQYFAYQVKVAASYK